MLSLDRILKVAQFNEEYGYYSPTMEQHTRRQPAMTFDDWKATLLPLGWMEIYGCVLQSPLSPGGTSVQLVQVNDMTNAAYLLTSYESIELEDPIETPYQMMSLLHGLGIITEETFNGFQRSEQSAEPNEPTQSQQPNESTVSDASNESTQPCESDRVDTADR